MLRKLAATLTILILAISSVLPMQAYGDTDISHEGRICRDLGILKGNTGVVDSAYLLTQPSRLQAAVMFLRLKGLEQDALSYTGGKNFKDAGAVAWKEGRNVLSYLKDHPGLGWIGDGVNFLPYNLIDSKAYYKVLLESLGYKQKIDGDGDFDWSSVLAFAEEKGLKKVAGIKSFTVDSLAIATVEALNTKMKSSGKKLIEYLVEIGDVDRRDAEALDLYSGSIDGEVKAVRAISNSKVEVVFEEPVSSGAEDDDLYTIKQLEIKGASMKNESAVIINTSAMNEGSTYTLVFDNKSYSFKGLKKDSYAPKLIAAECKDTDLVELTFDRVLDNVTAQNTDIYSIEGVSIKSAELDGTNTKVRLITSGIQAGHSYDLKIKGIKNGDGVAAKSIIKRFAGRKDTTAPKLSKLTVLNNVKLLLEFSDSNGLDKATAQRVDNYRITSNAGSLDVESVAVKDRDDDGLWDAVELVTDSQDAGREYTLIIEVIADDSILGNKTTRETKREFRGKSADKSGPTVGRNPIAVTNTLVEIEFEDSNALDIESACDIDNYEIEGGLEVIQARIKDKDNLYSAEGRTVLLITSEMEKSESYTLEISGIQDEFGNDMRTSSSSGSKKYRFRGLAEDRTPPYITFVECIDSKTIELNFDNLLDEESAETITNYRVDGLAIATKAVLQEDGKTVRLTVSSLSSDKNHKILLNNIEDLSGNAMSNISVGILYNGSLYDDDPPEVDYIEAVNNKEVWIRFEEEIYAENARMKASGISFEQVGNVLDKGTTVVMRALSTMDDDEYEVTSLSGIWDLRNNVYELQSGLEFYGTRDENDPPEVDDWDQLDARRFRVIFSEPVLLTKDHEVSGIKNPSGVSIEWKAVLNPDEEDTDEAYSTVDYIAKDKNITADKEFRFNFTDMVHDYSGAGVKDEDDYDYGASGSTVLEAYIEDDEEPYIEYVEALTRNKAQIIFNEEIREAGRYKITYYDDDGKLRTIDISLVEVDSKNKTRVNIYTEDVMSDEYYFILEPLSAAVDIAGNKLDIDDLEIDFDGSNIMSSDYIQGVEVLNAYTLRVSKSSDIYNVSTLYELDEAGNNFGGNLIESVSRVSDNVYKIISKKPLLKAVRYEITVDGLEYKFYGGVQSGGLELELPEREITYDNMDLSKYDVKVYRADGHELQIIEKGGHYEIEASESLSNGEKLYIYVERESDWIIIYGTRIKVEGMPAVSSAKAITSFLFQGLNPAIEGKIDEAQKTITLTVPFGTDVSKLKASITASPEAHVRVGEVKQVSGETANDFTKPVTYTVIAQNDTVKNYIVNVSIAQSSEKMMKEFWFDTPKAIGIIDEVTKSINVKVPYDTDVKILAAVFKFSDNSTIKVDNIVQDSGTTINDFTKPVKYTVIAQDGSAQDYTVTVAAAAENEKYMTEFAFAGLIPPVKGIIDEAAQTIKLSVPEATDLTNLIAAFSYIGKSAQIGKTFQHSGVTANNFSETVKYVITAYDGSSIEYAVLVNK